MNALTPTLLATSSPAGASPSATPPEDAAALPAGLDFAALLGDALAAPLDEVAATAIDESPAREEAPALPEAQDPMPLPAWLAEQIKAAVPADAASVAITADGDDSAAAAVATSGGNARATTSAMPAKADAPATLRGAEAARSPAVRESPAIAAPAHSREPRPLAQEKDLTPPSAVAGAPMAAAPIAAAPIARADAGTASTVLHIAPPIESPAFAPALASQVRWLVDGEVAQARLTLNPAEMGPVAVQIVVEGREARIDFSADVAATRQAIESSLPTLAAALVDSGLTLAGGGVFDGTPRRPQGEGPGGNKSRTARGAAAVDVEPAHSEREVVKPRGLIDLLA